MRRVVVYGSSGAGKSTFASALAERHGLAHIELDLLAYDADGIHVDLPVLHGRFQQALTADGWVVEGMHRDELGVALHSADTFVWLDYSRPVVAARLVSRLVGHAAFPRERHGRRMTLRSVVRRELPFVWTSIRKHPRRRAHGEALMERALGHGLSVHRLATPHEATGLLRK